MNKMILIFSLLIAFAISVEPECKPYEIFDEETNKCIKVCNEQQFVNQEEGICEYFCKKGEIFNSTTYTCYSNNSNEHDGVVPDDGQPDDGQPGNEKPDDDQTDDGKGKKQEKKCKGGFSIGGKCICGKDKKEVNGVCIDKKEKKGKNGKIKVCIGGFLKGGKCICGRGKKEANDICIKSEKVKKIIIPTTKTTNRPTTKATQRITSRFKNGCGGGGPGGIFKNGFNRRPGGSGRPGGIFYNGFNLDPSRFNYGNNGFYSGRKRIWLINLGVGPHTTIETIKEKIKDMEGIPIEKQRLLHFGRQLEDNRTLADYNIKKYASLELIVILR